MFGKDVSRSPFSPSPTLLPLAHVIHDRFYCTRRYEAGNQLVASSSRAKTTGLALDLASAVATHVATRFPQPSGQARRSATGKGAHPGAPGLGGCDRGHTVSSMPSSRRPLGLKPASWAPTKGASPLVRSPRRGRTPFGNPQASVSASRLRVGVPIALLHAMGPTRGVLAVSSRMVMTNVG